MYCKPTLPMAAFVMMWLSAAAFASVSISVDERANTAAFTFAPSPMPRKLYLAYGNADGGATTNGWPECAYLQTVPAGVASLAGVALPSGFGTAYRMVRAFIEKPMTAKDYVQTGLAALYDCRENVGWDTFDASAAVWRNLVSDDRGTDLALATSGTTPDYFATDNVHLAGGTRKTTESAIADEGDTLSMEFNMKPPTGTSGKEQWFAMVGGLGRIGFRDGYAHLEIAHPQTSGQYCYRWFYNFLPSDGAYHTCTAKGFNRNGARVNTAWLDGIAKSQSQNAEYGGGAATTDTTYKFMLGFASQVALDLRSVRVYTNSLTDAQIALNRKVDASRFDGVDVPLESSDTVLADVQFQIARINKGADKVTPVSLDIEFPPTNALRKVCIGWGRKDMGENLDAWDNVAVLTNAQAGAAAMTVLVPPELGAQLLHRGFRLFLGSTTAKDYVQTGLAALYDCRENAGWDTFDASAAAWRNLVSDDRGTDLALATSGTNPDYFATDNVHLAGGTRKTTESAIADEGDTLSMEFNMKPPTGTSGKEQWFAVVGGLGRIGFRDGCAHLEIAHPQTSGQYCYRWFYNFLPSDGAYHTCAAGGFNRAGTRVKTAWLDGVAKSQSQNAEYGGGAATTDTTYKFMLGFATQVALDLRSVRVYTNSLTDAQIALNRKVDVSRFEDGLPFHYEASAYAPPSQKGLVLSLR